MLILPIRGDDTFIRTFTGRKFWPLSPRTEEIVIEDIAHPLSLICRFTGHCYCFYSVAEHSVRVSELAERLALERFAGFEWRIASARAMALWGLMHDATEAYLCDVPSPLKRTVEIGTRYKRFERQLMDIIAARFELGPHEPSIVKDADRILLSTEMRDLMSGCVLDDGVPLLQETIYPWDAQRAEVEFMRRFEALTMARTAARAAAALEAEVQIATALSQASREGTHD